MALFRKRTRRQPDDEYVILRDDAGRLEGLWLSDVKRAKDAVIGMILARHGLQGEVVASRYRVVHNTFNDRGGVFVRFVGDNTTVGADALPRQELVVEDQRYLVHEDFDTFSRDALAGTVALLKTTIAGASMDELTPLYRLLAEVYGDDAPEAHAALNAPFQCLICLRRYPTQLLHLRDMKRAGTAIAGITTTPGSAEMATRMLSMTACLTCGSENAVFVYNPRPPDQQR